MDKQAVRIEEKVHSYIRSNHMLDDCRHIVVGVSGRRLSVPFAYAVRLCKEA